MSFRTPPGLCQKGPTGSPGPGKGPAAHPLARPSGLVTGRWTRIRQSMTDQLLLRRLGERRQSVVRSVSARRASTLSTRLPVHVSRLGSRIARLQPTTAALCSHGVHRLPKRALGEGQALGYPGKTASVFLLSHCPKRWRFSCLASHARNRTPLPSLANHRRTTVSPTARIACVLVCNSNPDVRLLQPRAACFVAPREHGLWGCAEPCPSSKTGDGGRRDSEPPPSSS